MAWKLFAAAVIASVTAVTPAAAQTDPALDADLRCALVGLSLAGLNGATPEQQQAGTLVSLFYIGRLQGRAPSINLESEIEALSGRVTPTEMQAEGQRCGAEMTAVGQSLIAMGQNMQRRAQEGAQR